MRKHLFNLLLLANTVILRRDKPKIYLIAFIILLYYSIFVLGYDILDIIMSGRVISIYESLFIIVVSSVTRNKDKEESNKGIQADLHPYYIVGFTDAEATFTISITKDNRERKTVRRQSKDKEREIYSIHPSFAISLNIKDKDLISKLQSYFGVGRVKQDLGNNAIAYYVNSVKDLTSIIIPFFNKYPLITQKRADFILFKLAIELMNDGAHLTTDGIKTKNKKL